MKKSPWELLLTGHRDEAVGAIGLQRIGSEPALAEFARAITVSVYGDFVRRFKSSRPT